MTRLIRILLFSLFFFSKGYAINKTGDPFLLGAMFSRTDINGKVYALGNVLLAAFILAVNEINNRTDILPNTPIKISVRDSRLDSNQAVTQTLYLAANAFGNGVGVNAVIGPITSGDSITSAVVAQAFELTQISPAATSPQLSYRKPNFGFFSRTVPSDSFQGQAIADLIAYYNWRKVCVVVSNDSYGNGLANSFSARIKNYKNIQIFVASVGLNLPSYQNVFSLFANDYCRIWVLFMLEIDAGVLIENGYNSNIFVEGTQIIGGDATLDSGLWQNISAANVPKVIKGLMGFLPSFPITQKRGLEFVRSFIDQPSTVGNATACDTTKDDDGNYLYQTLVSPNKFQCLGVNFSTFNSDGSNFQPYTGYAYDAVYAAALAAHSMIYLQKELNPIYWSHVGLNTHYYDTLMNVSFQGATGLVKFSPSNTTDGTNYPEGDRLTDIFYTLYNFQPNAYLQDPSGKSGLVRVGFWTPSLGMRVCSFYQYGPLPIPGCQVIFNTPDNSNPVDGLPPITLDTSTTVTNVLFPMAMIIFAFTFAAFLLFVNLWGKTFLSKIKREKLFYLLIGCLFAGGKVLMFSLNITDSNCSISAWCGHIAVWCIGTTLIMKVSYQQRSFILQVMMRFSDYRRLNEPIKSNHLEFDQLLSRKLQDTSFKLTKSVKLPDADIHSIATPKSSVTPTGRIPGHQDLTNTNIHPLSSSRNSDEAGVEMKYSPSGINHVIDMSVKNMSAFSPSPRLSALVGSMTKQSPTTDNGKYSVIAPSDKTECNHERESTVNTPCIEAEAGNSVPSIEPTHEARMLAASTEAIHDSTPMPEMKPTMVSEHINDSLFMPYGSSVYSPTSIVHKNNSLPFYLTAKGVSVRRVCLGLLFIFVIGFLFLIQFVGIPRVTNVSYTSGPQEYIQMECGYKVSGVSLALVYIEFTALIMGTLYCRWTKYQRVTYKLEQRIIFRCLILFIVLFTVVIAYDNITTDYISYELSAGVAYFILSMLALMTVIYVAVTRHLALEKLPVHRAIADDESPEVVMDLIMKYPSTLGQRDLDNLTVFDWAIAAFEQEYQRKYISGLQDPELDGQDRSLNAVATSLEWWPIINSIVLNTLPVDSKDPDLGPVPAEIHGYMWTRLVQSDRHAQIIEHLLDDNAESRLPEKLAAATDADGRKAVDLASPLCKRVLLESMYFLKRYELTTNERAHYQSRTSIILFAIDHWDQERPVALKMMKHVEQLEKEVKTRQQANFNDTFVVNVNRYYSADLDSLYMTALKKWNLTDYPYCIVMPKGERDVGEILSKENIDLDSMRVVARQIALCLQHVHHIGYVHGDIKRKYFM